MDEGLKNLIQKAESGDIEAMVMVADCYNKGFHTMKDDTKAQTYYKIAADNGHSQAAFMAGLGYLNGCGVKKDKKMATKYLEQAANNNLANAQYMLGILYKSGEIGLFFKEQKAIKYLEAASKQGHAKAQIALGDMNMSNDGPQYTVEKGIFWYACAYLHGERAHEESTQAMERLNTILQVGISGGKKRIDGIMSTIKSQHPEYLKNPK